jgi:hypothetical protein
MRAPGGQVLAERGDERVALRRRLGPKRFLDEPEEPLDALRRRPSGHGIDTRRTAHPWDHASGSPIDRRRQRAVNL